MLELRCEITVKGIISNIIILNNIFGPTLCYAPAKCGNLMFHDVSLNVATPIPISKFDTFSSYHSTIGISMYQKSMLPHFIIPCLFTPSFFPFGAFQTDRMTEKILHPLLPKLFFFTERVGPYLQAQLYCYWAGRTMGWMAD